MKKLILAVYVLSASACGLNMEKNYRKMRSNLLSHDYEAAGKYIDSVKESFYSKDNRLLYYMDKGMVSHLAKNYKESNEFLEKAKSTAEDLWTESISKNAEAWLTTDNSVPYQGEDFEKVLIHFVAALNYMATDDFEAARVEARQMNNKLAAYNAQYAKEERSVYADDAFARYLAGKLAETEGGAEALNDAWIDYKKAIDVYSKDYAQRYATPTPPGLVADALRVVEALGNDFRDEYGELSSRFSGAQFTKQSERKSMAEVVFVHLNGEAPYKVDKFWTAQAGIDTIRIPYPEFVPKNHGIVRARLKADNQTATTELAENITAIALQSLNDHLGRIKTKAIARQVTKYIAQKALQAGGQAVGKKNSELGAAMWVAGALWNVGDSIAQEADKRSWITLPAEVHVGRLFVPAGTAKLDVEFVDGGGTVLEHAEFDIKAEAGKTTFVSYRTYR